MCERVQTLCECAQSLGAHLHPHTPSGCHTWAHISAHLTLQLKDFSIVLLLQALVFDLQVDQLLADLGLVRVRGGVCEALGLPSLLPAPRSPTPTCSRCSSLSSRSEGSSVPRLVAQAEAPPATPGSQASTRGRT